MGLVRNLIFGVMRYLIRVGENIIGVDENIIRVGENLFIRVGEKSDMYGRVRVSQIIHQIYVFCRNIGLWDLNPIIYGINCPISTLQ